MTLPAIEILDENATAVRQQEQIDLLTRLCACMGVAPEGAVVSAQFCQTSVDLAHPVTPVYPTVAVPVGWTAAGVWGVALLYHGNTPDRVIWTRRIYRMP